MGRDGTIREQLAERGYYCGEDDKKPLCDYYYNEDFDEIVVVDSVRTGWRVALMIDSDMPEEQQEAYINEYKELKKIIA